MRQEVESQSRRELVERCRRRPCTGACALVLEQVDGESLDLHVSPLNALDQKRGIGVSNEW